MLATLFASAALAATPPVIVQTAPVAQGGHSWLSIFAASIGWGLGAAALDEYRTWKRNRTELVVSKDWRGRPVVDRKLKLFERCFTWAMVSLVLFGLVMSYAAIP